MPGHDIIVIGASAGGVEALTELVRGLPGDLPAAVFVVLHIPSYRPSDLPFILSRRGVLPAAHPEHGEVVRQGRIYIAPPDRHLTVRGETIGLSHGPRENGTRPAIDPLFRTAARSYGDRVVGVILSGTNGDGTIGMMAIKARGGLAIAQDPADALFDRMPRHAIRNLKSDYILPVSEIGPLLARLASEPVTGGAKTMAISADDTPGLIRRDQADQEADRRGGTTAIYSCPECHGVFWQLDQEQLTQFRCLVGHTYSPEYLLVKKSEKLEAALWAAVRTLVEKAVLTRQLATRARAAGKEESAASMDELADLDDRQALLIRESLLEAIPNPTSQSIEVQRHLDAAGHPERAPEGKVEGQ
jgi:two-component system chemotaxis response regulator CheB